MSVGPEVADRGAMSELCVSLCQGLGFSRGTLPVAVALVLPFALGTQACGTSDRDQDPPLGSGSMGGGGESGGSAGMIGVSGSGGSHCDGGACGSCGEWPAGCEVTCESPIGACLVAGDGSFPVAPLTLEAQVTSAGTSPWPGSRCIGQVEGDATRVSLIDGAGDTWSLSFPVEMVSADRFAEGAELVVEYAASGSSFRETRSLIVSEQGQVVAFAFKSDASTFDVPGADLTLSVGEMACPPSLPGISGCCSAEV